MRVHCCMSQRLCSWMSLRRLDCWSFVSTNYVTQQFGKGDCRVVSRRAAQLSVRPRVDQRASCRWVQPQRASRAVTRAISRTPDLRRIVYPQEYQSCGFQTVCCRVETGAQDEQGNLGLPVDLVDLEKVDCSIVVREFDVCEKAELRQCVESGALPPISADVRANRPGNAEARAQLG
jgi:hypothetical protein